MTGMNRMDVTVEDATDPLLLDLALEDDFRAQANRWGGFDVYASGDRYIRTTVEDGAYHLFGFTGWNLDWSIDFSIDTPDVVFVAAVRSAYGTLVG